MTRLLISGLLSAALLGCSADSPSPGQSARASTPGELDLEARQCVLDSPARAVGAGLDAPSLAASNTPPDGQPGAACRGRSDFQFGTALHDVTGVIADTASPAWVNPQQVFSALHSRVYARAYVIASPCNGKRLAFVSIDTGLMSSTLRNAVLAEIAADDSLASLYNGNNVMLSVTHTHSDPNTGLVGGNNGLAVIAGGTVAAIRKAQQNLQAHPATGRLSLSSGELLNTNINRSKPAFLNNPPEERAAFLNTRAEEVQVDKAMHQLEFYREGDLAAGLINWFGVHPTVIGPAQSFVSGDVKGEAALGFERLMGTDYRADPELHNFVAAFAQAVEGDASPNIFIEEFPHPDPRRGGGENDLDSNRISALKQLARALELFGQGEMLSGPVDYRFMTVSIDAVRVDDPVVLASLEHPVELDSVEKRTCSGILGASFGAGAEDGPGPTVEGLSCKDDPDVLAAAQADMATAAGTQFEGFPGGWPAETIPGALLSAAAFCNVAALPPLLGDFSCQAEKPLLLPRGGTQLPFQLFRIGQLAILGLPWEVTTVSARRIRALLMAELGAVGIDTLVIAGLVNDYVHYLTTREEYATQQYEGASTLYGPWTLAAVQQEGLKLARALRSGEPQGDALDPGARANLALAAGPQDTPHPSGAVGTVIRQPAAEVRQGETVRFEIVAGHPANDLRLQDSYATVERQTASGEWTPVVEDRAPELLYFWKPQVENPVAIEPPLSSSGSAEAAWAVPGNAPAGTYRIRMTGASRSQPGGAAQGYEVISDSFRLGEPIRDCP